MSRREIKATAFLLVLCAATFWRVSQCDFVGYDDPDYVTRNSYVRRGLGAESVAWAFGNVHGVATYWHPVTWLSHMLDVQLFGVHAGAHHLINLFFHSLNVVLLFLVLARMTDEFWRSLALAALWAVHPLQVDTVAWITERKNLLSGLFWILTMAAYVRYARKPSVSRYLLVFASMAIGLMCKPTLVTLPCALLLLDWWPLKRTTWFHGTATTTPEPTPDNRSLKFALASPSRLLLEKVPLFAVSLASGLLTIVAHERLQGIAVSTQLSFQQRFWNALVSYARYLDKTVWPAKLAVFYPHPGSWPVAHIAASVVVLIVVSIVAGVLARRAPYLIVGWLWFLIVMFPTIGLIQAGSQSMADRFAYLPLIGLLLMMCWSGFDLLERLELKPPALLVPWFAVVLALSVVAGLQVRYWKNNQTLFAHALDVTDKNYLALAALGNDLVDAGRYDEARQYLVAALEINPGYTVTYTLLARLYVKVGRFEDAEPLFRQALQMTPGYAEGHVAYANALVQQRRYADALEHFELAIRFDPGLAEAYNGLGTVRVHENKPQEALAAFETAIRLRPGFVEALQNYGVTLHNQGRVPEAAAKFEELLRQQPNSILALLHLGNARLTLGQFREAQACFQRVLQIDPNSLDALHRVAWMLATQNDPKLRDGPEAVRLARRACEIAGTNSVASLNVMAAAYAEVGQFTNAVAEAEQALNLARSAGQSGLANIIEKLLDSYRRGQPYREAPP
jgi:tetratricopeptide (TPR) repeat protein